MRLLDVEREPPQPKPPRLGKTQLDCLRALAAGPLPTGRVADEIAKVRRHEKGRDGSSLWCWRPSTDSVRGSLDRAAERGLVIRRHGIMWALTDAGRAALAAAEEATK